LPTRSRPCPRFSPISPSRCRSWPRSFSSTCKSRHREIALIREGNSAAAVSLSGTLIGFALPVANVIENSHNLVDLAIWSVIACAVQIAAYVVARLALPQIARDIPAGKLAPAIFLAALSVSVGLINAACMEY
jgi:putative membrane protein